MLESKKKKTPTNSKTKPVRMELSCFNNFLKGTILSWESSNCAILQRDEILWNSTFTEGWKGKSIFSLNRGYHLLSNFMFFGLNIKGKLRSVFKFWISFYSRLWSINVLGLVCRLPENIQKLKCCGLLLEHFSLEECLVYFLLAKHIWLAEGL